ncbi:ligase-associated DNA damage response DEXH box helicase [Coralloluteibacterium stylophorae]|uniref:Ligase-associated DNA damage response DEXH box helicase n=2 Tax=Coralloluteibacterium stylophorae TaxID=1776034 RepID=A0AAP2CEB8_9GAMM|nr:ligase-associated DNA damage response DEXH box helicase [Coralloluteibacterium stylophorae]
MAPEADARVAADPAPPSAAPARTTPARGRRSHAAADAQGPEAFDAWFEARGWSPAPFQREAWAHYLAGRSGLLHAPTGSGKTLAVWGGPLLSALAQPPAPRAGVLRRLRVLWITPLKALAEDTARALRDPLADLGLDWQVGIRTGDASARDRKAAREGRFDALVTTPESLSLLLTYADTAPVLAGLEAVIVDEWHELMASKRGVLLELALARLRALAPRLRIWGLSATLGNLDEARRVLLPHAPDAPLVHGVAARETVIDTLIPPPGERFPWAGHLGLAQLPRVLERILGVRTSLLFTNTRSQAELWHQALAAVWPEAPETLALHHGSIDAALRHAVEDGLRAGALRCVVATSSLDLGVDFPTVDQVLQVGSPRGIARLLQRAGRAGHRPGAAGRIVCVPTNTLELLEFAAARHALTVGRIEARPPLRLSLDVLAQHLVTLALGGGFEAEAAYAEVRGTHAFAALGRRHWQAVLDFVVQGGAALSNYPDFARVVRTDDGRYAMSDRRQALRHRLSIGTIVSDGTLQVRYLKGGALGSVEEAFIARMTPGTRFAFAGRTLEFVRIRDMTAYVRRVEGGRVGAVRWMGAKMPLSSELGAELRRIVAGHDADAPEVAAARPILDLQARISALPDTDTLLVESLTARGEQQLFLYPFAGRHVHEGLGALFALRLARMQANTFSFAVSDYGLVVALARPMPVDDATLAVLLTPDGLLDDLHASLNMGELARRQFREIARVAGLLPPSLPGRTPPSLRALQASSGLIYDVLRQHDPGHVLLDQAEREVFEAQLEFRRLRATLERLHGAPRLLARPQSLTPLGFPLWAERIRGNLSNEDWRTRVERAAERLEARWSRG